MVEVRMKDKTWYINICSVPICFDGVLNAVAPPYTAEGPGRQVARLPDSLPDLADPIEFGGRLAGFEDKGGECRRSGRIADRGHQRLSRPLDPPWPELAGSSKSVSCSKDRTANDISDGPEKLEESPIGPWD